jgi:hypothetical protein
LYAPTILSKCEYFVDVALWPIHQHLDFRSWLRNFSSAEEQHAVHLLNGFFYYPESLLNNLVSRTLRQLSLELAQPADDLDAMRARWRTF